MHVNELESSHRALPGASEAPSALRVHQLSHDIDGVGAQTRRELGLVPLDVLVDHHVAINTADPNDRSEQHTPWVKSEQNR